MIHRTHLRRALVIVLSCLLTIDFLVPNTAVAQELAVNDESNATAVTDDESLIAEDGSFENATGVDNLEDGAVLPEEESSAEDETFGLGDAASDAENQDSLLFDEQPEKDAKEDEIVEIDPTDIQVGDSDDAEDGLVTIQEDDTTTGNASDAKNDALSLSYRVRMPSGSWQKWVGDGTTAGDANGGKRIEGLALKLSDAKGKGVAGIKYQTYVQGEGWQSWVSDGSASGLPKKHLQIEAVRIALEDGLAQDYDIWYRCYVQGFGWQGWASNGASSGSTCLDKRIEAVEVTLAVHGSAAPGSTSKAYVDGTHVTLAGRIQNKGRVTGTSRVGLINKGVRLEAFSAKLVCGDYSGGITYAAYVQGTGWQKARKNGKLAGTTGKSRRIEAVRLSLTGKAKRHYDVWYRVYVHDYGWLAWTKNWSIAGTEGFSKRVECLQVKVLSKGGSQPKGRATKYDGAYLAFPSFKYASQSAGASWQRYRSAGKTSGSTGATVGIERVRMLTSVPEGAATCVMSYGVRQNDGAWVYGTQGAMVGDSNSTVSSLRIKLQGPLAKLLNVYYRVYISGVGWLKWVKNNRITGTEGLGKSVERYQVRVLAKVNPAPKNTGAYTNTRYYDSAYVKASSTPQPLAKANAKQRKIVNAALTTPSPGGGLCADWVERVYNNAGFGMHWGNADDLYDAYCRKSSLGDLKVGMIVAVSSHPHTSLGSIYGHVGIYVGDGWIMDNIGYIRKISLTNWLSYYGETVTPKWGWLGNVKVA